LTVSLVVAFENGSSLLGKLSNSGLIFCDDYSFLVRPCNYKYALIPSVNATALYYKPVVDDLIDKLHGALTGLSSDTSETINFITVTALLFLYVSL